MALWRAATTPLPNFPASASSHACAVWRVRGGGGGRDPSSPAAGAPDKRPFSYGPYYDCTDVHRRHYTLKLSSALPDRSFQSAYEKTLSGLPETLVLENLQGSAGLLSILKSTTN